MGEWLVWTILPAFGIAYGITGSELLALPRAYLVVRFPRSLGALVECAPCTGCWCAVLVREYVEAFAVRESLVGRMVLCGLACAGLLWILSAFSGGLARLARAIDAIGQAIAFGQQNALNRAQQMLDVQSHVGKVFSAMARQAGVDPQAEEAAEVVHVVPPAAGGQPDDTAEGEGGDEGGGP